MSRRAEASPYNLELTRNSFERRLEDAEVRQQSKRGPSTMGTIEAERSLSSSASDEHRSHCKMHVARAAQSNPALR